MKNLFNFLIIALAIAFTSCEKPVDQVKDTKVQVAFELNNPAINNPGSAALKGGTLKAGGDEQIPECVDGTPTQVHIKGVGPGNVQFEMTLDLLQNYDDGKQTVVVKLEPGHYTVDLFEVLDDAGNLLWVSPLENSYYDDLFDFQNNVTVDFDIEAFTKNKVDIDVLCWRNFAYQEFGYVWFDYHNYEIHTVCFFGDICTKFYDEWSTVDGSAYSGVQIQGYDFPALFSVTVVDAQGHATVADNYTGEEIGQPVCVEYLDNLEVDDEEYTAYLNLLLPDGSSVTLDSILFTDTDRSDTLGVSSWGGEDAIWEFAVGDCAMAAHQEDINGVYNIPWVPTPDEMTFKLVNTRPQGYFALGNIQPDIEVGEFVTGDTLRSWCGAHDASINWNHTYKAKVYPYFNTPAGSYLEAITLEQWAKLNWVANEVIPDQVADNAEMNEIQNAVWEILGQTNDGSGASIVSSAPTSYIPPLGGYVIVIVDPYQDITNETKCSRQFQLAIVRFDP